MLERGNSPYKAMLLNEVVMGKAIKLYTDQPSLTEVQILLCAVNEYRHTDYGQPPTDFDSVIGEPGTILNYDEAIGMHAIYFARLRHLIRPMLNCSV